MHQEHPLPEPQKRSEKKDSLPPKNLQDVRVLYPTPEATACQATERIRKEVEFLGLILKVKKKLTEQEEKVKCHIMGYMKAHETLLDGEDILATWKGHTRTLLDTDRLKANFPSLYEQYKKEQVTRVFRLKENPL